MALTECHDIQAAIDSLPIEGGCVCLKTGVHNVSIPIRIHSSHTILRGESPGVIVRAAEQYQTILDIQGNKSLISDIIVEGIRFEAMAAANVEGALLTLYDCIRVRVEHCSLAVMVSPKENFYIGIKLQGDVDDIDLIANRLDNFNVGIRFDSGGANQVGVNITDNVITGKTGKFLDRKLNGSIGQYGIWIVTDATQAYRIENNCIRHFWVGISLDGHSVGSLISGNFISRSEGDTNEKFPNSAQQMRDYLDSRFYAIDISDAQCEVRNNQIDLFSAAWGGIRISGDYAIIAGNTMNAELSDKGMAAPAGIYCLDNAKGYRGANHVVVRDNQLLGRQSGIILSRIASPLVIGNHVDGVGRGFYDTGWYGVWVDACSDSCIYNNTLRELLFAVHVSEGERNRIVGNRIDHVVTGITATEETNLEISGNLLQSCLLLGMALFVRGTTALLKNRVLNCSYAPPNFLIGIGVLNFSIGIGVFAEEMWTPSGAHLRIEDCEVIDTGISANDGPVTTANAIGIGCWVPSCQISGNRVGYTQYAKLEPLNEHRALVLIGPFARYDPGQGGVGRHVWQRAGE